MLKLVNNSMFLVLKFKFKANCFWVLKGREILSPNIFIKFEIWSSHLKIIIALY